MTSRNFQLQTSTIIQLLGEREFYEQCVAFLFMRDQGLASVEKYHQAVADKEAGCEGCDQKFKNESAYIEAHIATFVRLLRQLYAIRADHLAPIREFIERKLGYQPAEILLTYREGGKTHTLKF